MSTTALHAIDDDSALTFYRTVLRLLRQSGVETLVGGTYALEQQAGLARGTKDLDLFVRPGDWPRVVDVTKHAGFNAVLVFPHWLGKVYAGPRFVDFVFGGGNGVVHVDDEWFAHAADAEISGERVKVCPPEEGIWSKAFIMERERFDGADVLHMLRVSGRTLDWERLVSRFSEHGSVLLAHLVLFAFVYPSERDIIPRWVVQTLTTRFMGQHTNLAGERVCFGTLLSRAQYLVDVSSWGYADARLSPHGAMSVEQVDLWTAAALDEMPDPTGIAIDAQSGTDASSTAAALSWGTEMSDQPADHTRPESRDAEESTEYPGARRTPMGESVDPSHPQSDITPGTGARAGRPSASSATTGQAIETPALHDMMPPLDDTNASDHPHHAKTIRHGGDPADESGKTPL